MTIAVVKPTVGLEKFCGIDLNLLRTFATVLAKQKSSDRNSLSMMNLDPKLIGGGKYTGIFGLSSIVQYKYMTFIVTHQLKCFCNISLIQIGALEVN